MFLETDQALGLLALVSAVEAGGQDEIPVGAVLLDGYGFILAQSGNRPVSTHDPLAHAEIVALGKAAKRLANYRLTNTRMLVTLQPCPMCFEALKISRVSEVLFLCEQSGTMTDDGSALPFTALSPERKKMLKSSTLKEAAAGILRFFFARRRVICLNPHSATLLEDLKVESLRSS